MRLRQDRNKSNNPSQTRHQRRHIRRVCDEKSETWWFSVVDVIQVLIDQPDFQKAGNYWKVLRHRLVKEGSEVVTSCNRLKLTAPDGKSRLTDAATVETLLRLVQSIPSSKAESINLWLAKVGQERMQEMADPSRSLERARETWTQHGRSEKWIRQRSARDFLSTCSSARLKHCIAASRRATDSSAKFSSTVGCCMKPVVREWIEKAEADLISAVPRCGRPA